MTTRISSGAGIALTLIFAGFCVSPVGATQLSSNVKKLQQKVAEQEAEIELLKLRLERLEAGAGGLRGASSGTTASAPRPAAITFP
jgi:outer membrane murein-binding lipoprotein Lpp